MDINSQDITTQINDSAVKNSEYSSYVLRLPVKSRMMVIEERMNLGTLIESLLGRELTRN